MALRSLFSLAAACVFAVGCASVPVITPTQAASAPAPVAEDGAVDEQAGDARASARVDQAEAAEVNVVPDIDRSTAIAQFAELAFLSFGDASCVIDALHEEVGVYNFASPEALEQADQPALIEMCMTGQISPAPPSQDNRAESDSGAAAPVEQFEPPVLEPGSFTSSLVTLAGRTVPYGVITPDGFQIGDSAPVFIALTDDRNDWIEATEYLEATFLQSAVDNGWIVVSPAPVAGTWHDNRNGEVMADLVRWLDSWVAVQGTHPHLGGAASGGDAAFAMAASQPGAFKSLMIYPGFLKSQPTETAEKLAGLPIRMWAIDSTNSPWLPGMVETEAALKAAGADVYLRVFSLDDLAGLTDGRYGELIFDELVVAQ